MEDKFYSSPDKRAEAKIIATRSDVMKREEDIEKIRSAKSPQLTPRHEVVVSQSDKKSIKKLQQEIKTLKDEAKEYIDNLPLPAQRQQKYKDRIDGKTAAQEKDQKDFFEKEGIKKEFNQEPQSKNFRGIKFYEDAPEPKSKFISKDKDHHDKDDR